MPDPVFQWVDGDLRASDLPFEFQLTPELLTCANPQIMRVVVQIRTTSGEADYELMPPKRREGSFVRFGPPLGLLNMPHTVTLRRIAGGYGQKIYQTTETELLQEEPDLVREGGDVLRACPSLETEEEG